MGEDSTNTKNKRGQPRKFKTEADLQEAIDDYFQNAVPTRPVSIGKKVVNMPVPTITGLVYHLGFADRKSFYEYELIPEYTHTIKRARTFIEKHYEELLQVGNTTGAIFALKNFGWSDKQEIEHSGGGGLSVNLNVQRRSKNDKKEK